MEEEKRESENVSSEAQSDKESLPTGSAAEPTEQAAEQAAQNVAEESGAEAPAAPLEPEQAAVPVEEAAEPVAEAEAAPAKPEEAAPAGEAEAEEEEKAAEGEGEAEAKPEAKEKKKKKAAKPEPLGERKWYVIQTLTGQEDLVKQSIERTIKSEGLTDKVFQVLVPTEDTVEIKGGKRVEKIRKMFPGYVFLEMILDEESWYQMRETPGVARFIGTKVKPTPVSEKEMQRVLKQLGKEERLEITFEKGEAVRVISGPFRGYTGTVDEVNAEKGKLKVLINIFGRDTPVEVNFEHAQKIV